MNAHFESAERFKNEGRFDEAIEELRLVLRLDPGCTEAILRLARLFYLSKQLPESISSFIHAEARGAKLDADDLFILGEAYATKSFHRKAIESYDRSLALAESADTQFARGTSYHKLQEFDNAGQCYLDVLRLKPEHTDALFSLASVLAEKEDFPKALLTYEKWMTIRHGGTSARHSVAVARLNNGNPSGALEELRIMLTENPDDSEACFLEGYAQAELGDVQKASEALARCMKLNTHHPLALNLLLHLKKA
jgi:cytochrome c-type biogenesis protein CcmH/NrfG